MSSLDWFLAADAGLEIADVGALHLRLTTGLFLVYYHGWHKLAQGVRFVTRCAEWPLLKDVTMLGMPAPIIGAFAATLTQLMGGCAVAVGFLTRPAAAAVMGSLLVASYANFRVRKDNQMALLYASLYAGFVLYGGGRYSLDYIFFGRVP